MGSQRRFLNTTTTSAFSSTMAPNVNTKARNGVGVGVVANGKPLRRVVPAIPLTYERRLKANVAAKHAAAQAHAASVPVVSLPRPAATTNGSSLKIQNDVDDSAPPTPKTLEPAIAEKTDNDDNDEKPAEDHAVKDRNGMCKLRSSYNSQGGC